VDGAGRFQAVAPSLALIRGEVSQIIAAIVPVVWIVSRCGDAGTEIIGTVQVPLARVACAVTCFLEVFTDCSDCLTEWNVIAPCPRVMGKLTGEQAGACRSAHRTGVVRTVEPYSLACKRIDVRGPHETAPGRAEKVPALTVGDQDDDVWFVLHERNFLVCFRHRPEASSYGEPCSIGLPSFPAIFNHKVRHQNRTCQ